MQKHIENYLKFFGYGDQDMILSEISGNPAASFHHIKYKSQGGKDNIENIIALTSEEHDQAHFKRGPYLHEDELKTAHYAFMKYKLSNTL